MNELKFKLRQTKPFELTYGSPATLAFSHNIAAISVDAENQWSLVNATIHVDATQIIVDGFAPVSPTNVSCTKWGHFQQCEFRMTAIPETERDSL